MESRRRNVLSAVAVRSVLFFLRIKCREYSFLFFSWLSGWLSDPTCRTLSFLLLFMPSINHDCHSESAFRCLEAEEGEGEERMNEWMNECLFFPFLSPFHCSAPDNEERLLVCSQSLLKSLPAARSLWCPATCDECSGCTHLRWPWCAAFKKTPAIEDEETWTQCVTLELLVNLGRVYFVSHSYAYDSACNVCVTLERMKNRRRDIDLLNSIAE